MGTKTTNQELVILPNLGLAIRLARVFSDITRKELSDSTGIAQSCLFYIEHSSSNPAYGSVIKIARALDIKISTLYLFSECLSQQPYYDKRYYIKLFLGCISFMDIFDMKKELINDRTIRVTKNGIRIK